MMGRSLRGRFTGVVRYADELIRALALRQDVALDVFVTRAADGLDGVGVRRVRAPFPTPNEYLRAIWEQCVVPRSVGQLRPDVYHSPNYILPLALSCPTVVTVHDLAFLDRRLHRLRSHVYLTVLATLSLLKATRIICVSEATRADLVRRFPAAASKVRVVGEGVDGRFRPRDDAAVAEFRARHGLAHPYILFVGTVEPRKNLLRLIQAYERTVERTGAPHELVLVGQRGWKDAPVWRSIHSSDLRQRIHPLGYLDDDDLAAAYSGADVFAYPSLHEGFGLPPLEAMSCGAAVLTSRVSAIPAIVGDAAVLVDPTDVEELAGSLARLVRDPAERRELRARGFDRAAQFRWEHVAARTLEVYAEAVA